MHFGGYINMTLEKVRRNLKSNINTETIDIAF